MRARLPVNLLPVPGGASQGGTAQANPVSSRLARTHSAFLRGGHEEGGGFLVDVFLAAVWAFDFALLVFGKAEDNFERLLAIITIKLVPRHGDLRGFQRGWA